MILHLPFERRLEDGREDAFDDILDFLCVLGLVGFHDLLGDIVCRSGGNFAFLPRNIMMINEQATLGQHCSKSATLAARQRS